MNSLSENIAKKFAQELESKKAFDTKSPKFYITRNHFDRSKDLDMNALFLKYDHIPMGKMSYRHYGHKIVAVVRVNCPLVSVVSLNSLLQSLT